MLAGLELGRQESNNTRLTGHFGNATSTSVDAASPRATVTRWAAQASDTNNRTTADIAALYVQDQMTLTPHWKAILGLRYDRYGVTIDDRNAANVDLAHTDKEFSPRAGLIYQPDAASSYYASYSYAFIPSGETLALTTSNADLAPEKATNWEIGAKWELTPRLSATATLFRLDRANVKSKDPNDSTKLVLSGLQRTEGVEVGLQGQVNAHWQIYAGYANLDAHVVKATGGSATSTAVALVPRNAASLWNRYDFGGGWVAGLGLVYQSRVFASSSNAVRLPSFARADGAVYYQIDKKTRLALNVENLLDRHYYATAGGDNIAFDAPERYARGEYWVGNRTVAVKLFEADALSTLKRLHMGSSNDSAWILLADALAGGLIFLALSGSLLWTRLSGPKLAGAALLLGGLGSAAWAALAGMT